MAKTKKQEKSIEQRLEEALVLYEKTPDRPARQEQGRAAGPAESSPRRRVCGFWHAAGRPG